MIDQWHPSRLFLSGLGIGKHQKQSVMDGVHCMEAALEAVCSRRVIAAPAAHLHWHGSPTIPPMACRLWRTARRRIANQLLANSVYGPKMPPFWHKKLVNTPIGKRSDSIRALQLLLNVKAAPRPYIKSVPSSSSLTRSLMLIGPPSPMVPSNSTLTETRLWTNVIGIVNLSLGYIAFKFSAFRPLQFKPSYCGKQGHTCVQG